MNQNEKNNFRYIQQTLKPIVKAEEFLTAFSNPDHQYHALMAGSNLNMPYVQAANDFMEVFAPSMDFIEQKRRKFAFFVYFLFKFIFNIN